MSHSVNKEIEMYRLHKSGMTISDIAKKYNFKESYVRQLITWGKCMDEEDGLTEWQKQFSRLATWWLKASGIGSEAELYEKVDNGVCVDHRLGRKSYISEINAVINKPIEVYRDKSRKDLFKRPLTFLRYEETGQKQNPKKPRKMKGYFRGCINGKYIEGEIEGEYESERRNSEVHEK